MPVILTELRKALENKRRINKTQRRLTPVKPGKSDEVDYRRSLLEMQRKIAEQVEREIFPLLIRLEPQYYQDTPHQDTFKVLDQIERGVNLIVEPFAKRAAALHVKKTSNTNKKRLQKSFERSFGISLSNLTRQENIQTDIKDHIDENVDLIKTIPEEYFSRLKNVLGRGIINGHKASDLRNFMRDTLDISERRIRLIARDQTSKINGNLTEVRSRNAGSKGYFWDGREDAIERPDHKLLQGQYFTWNKPPIVDIKTGRRAHPGGDYQCRCTARVVVDI